MAGRYPGCPSCSHPHSPETTCEKAARTRDEREGWKTARSAAVAKSVRSEAKVRRGLMFTCPGCSVVSPFRKPAQYRLEEALSDQGDSIFPSLRSSVVVECPACGVLTPLTTNKVEEPANAL